MSEPSWVYYFGDALPCAPAEAPQLLGGKGASLHRMLQARLSVPPGFTISTQACRSYFDRKQKWPDGLESQVRVALKRLERDTKSEFGRGAKPLLVSVRSGAARSMPGMMDTILNCGLHPGLANEVGDTKEFWALYIQFVESFARVVHGVAPARFLQHTAGGIANRQLAQETLHAFEHITGQVFSSDPWELLVACIDAVFQSWHSERAIAYRQRHGIRDLDGTGVNIQQMFPSEASGVAFTQDPTLVDSERIIVESSYGLGESVVSGEVTPDRFLVSRRDLSHIDATIGRKTTGVFALGARVTFDPDAPSLSNEQLKRLCELALKVELHFGHAVDIEWGLANNEFALLQSRAIRGLDVARDVELGRQEEVHRLKLAAGNRRHLWISHNLAETLSSPTPLTWDIVRDFMRGDGGFGILYQSLGYRPAKEVREKGFLELIAGRIYADPERLAQLFWDGLPLRYDLEQLAAQPSLLETAPQRFDADRADARFLASLPANLLAMWRIARRTQAGMRHAKSRFEEHELPRFLAYVAAEKQRSLPDLGETELVELLRTRIHRVLHEFGPASLQCGFFGGMALGRVQATLIQLLGPEEGAALASLLTRALDGDTTFEQDTLLFDVAKGRANMEQFLARFGHRAVGEMELAKPRWRERPDFLEGIVKRWQSPTARDPRELHRENRLRRDEAESGLPGVLARYGGSSFQEELVAQLRRARELLPYRESGKHYLMMGYELLREVCEQFAVRWDLGDDLYFLRFDELPHFTRERERFRELIAQRRIRHQAWQRLDLPDVIDSGNLAGFGLTREVSYAEEITGTPIAAGVATGRVRLVFNPAEAGNFERGDVLVCPSTDPGWTPLFLSAAALVVERGGVLSHGAIVARDFGIPAVAAPQATRWLAEGDLVRVDGNIGKVHRISRSGEHA